MVIHTAEGCYLTNPGGLSAKGHRLSASADPLTHLSPDSLHWNRSCPLPNLAIVSRQAALTLLLFQSTNCGPSSGGSGCQIEDTSTTSFGQAFNDRSFLPLHSPPSSLSLSSTLTDHAPYGHKEGGGVFALLWDGDGLQIWRVRATSTEVVNSPPPFELILSLLLAQWPSGSVPSDIGARTPNPTTWGTPMGAWAPSSCNPFSYFRQHSLTISVFLRLAQNVRGRD